MKKLLLVNPVDLSQPNLIMTKWHRSPPLGLGYIAALTPSDWQVSLIDENFEEFKYQDADLVGLTAFTCAAPRAYEIASVYHKVGIPTVMGGIHASMLPGEALHYVDSVVIGEGESVWARLLQDLVSGKLKRIYEGSREDLVGIVWPRRDLFSTNYTFGTIQTSRGCPMDCEFCSVSAFNGRQYRQRPVDEVLDEIDTIPHRLLFFVDDNLIGYGDGSRAASLFEGMIKRGFKKQWLCQASINFADSDEVLRLASKAGCRMVLIGLESEDTGALKELGKGMNLCRDYKEVFRRINHHGIAVLGAFMNGMDVDTPDAIHHRAAYAIKSVGVNAVQMSILTPLPGTRLFEKMKGEGRLLGTNFPDDWSKYSLGEVVYKPALMEPEKLVSMAEELLPIIYSYRTIWRKFFTTLLVTKSIITAVWAYRYGIAYRKVALSVLKKIIREKQLPNT